MDIGTAKPTADELARYHHYLIDIAEPDEPYSAARFCDMAGKAIAEVNGKGKIPILVGGTGLYVQSLLEGYDFQTARMTEADKEAAQARIDALSQEELKAYIETETDWQPPDWHELFSNTHRLTRLVSAIEQGEGKLFRPDRQGPGCSLLTLTSSVCACRGMSYTGALKSASTP